MDESGSERGLALYIGCVYMPIDCTGRAVIDNLL